MREYYNEIDDSIVRSSFTEEEMIYYKQITKEHIRLTKEIVKCQKEAVERLESKVIGKLTSIRFKYLDYNKKFYMQFETEQYIEKKYKWYLPFLK